MRITWLLVLYASVLIPFPLTMQAAAEENVWEKTTLGFQVNVTITNLGVNPATEVPLTLAIPLTMKHQTLVNYTSSPPANRTSKDVLGNSFLHYTIDEISPSSAYVVQLNLSVIKWSADLKIEKSKIKSYQGEEDNFLNQSQFIDVNHELVVQTAGEIANESAQLSDLAWNSYEWIIDNIFYQQLPGEFGAGETLRSGEGGSAEFGNLYVALLRSNLIPARRLSGYGRHFEIGEELLVTRFAHGWAEFYLPGYGWIQADPTWGINRKFDNFARTDDSHIVMTRGAGIHFFTRGGFEEPSGDTTLDTGYTLLVTSRVVENLSSARTVILAALFVPPALFAIFVLDRIRRSNAIEE